MTATTLPSGRRTAATWVGATGAFLLVAAAAVFVAVQWDELTETAKLALVGGLTGAFLITGRSVRRTLPATGDVLFHLGAFLVPVDLAGVCLRLDVDWRATLLAEGVVGVVLFTTLARFTASVVLRWAAAGSVMALAAGVAAVTPAPATLVLAVIAVGTELVGGRGGLTLRRAAVVWAAVAGLAPALGAAAGSVLEGAGIALGTGTLADLGLAGSTQQSVALLSGLLAAYVLARQAGAQRDLRLAYLALASVVVGIGTTVVATGVSGGVRVLGLAGLFVVVELAALAFFDDDFWGRPLAGFASVAEVFARIGTGIAAFALAFAPLLQALSPADAGSQRDITVAAALLLLALGWLTADMRRAVPGRTATGGLGRSLIRGSAWAEGTIWCAIALVAAVEIGTMASVPTAVAMVAVSALVLASVRAGAVRVAAVSVPFAVATVAAHPLAAPLVGIAGGAVLALAARAQGWAGLLLAAEAAAVAIGATLLSIGWLPAPAAVALAAAVAWGMAVILGDWLGDAARVGLLVPLAAACALLPVDAVGPLVAVAAFYTLDAVRLRRAVVAFGTAAAVQPLAVALAQSAGLTLPWAGFAVAVCAVVWAGLAFVVDDGWRPPFLAAAGTGLAVGLLLASNDGQALSDTLLLVGATGIAAGIGLRNAAVGHAGGALLIAGLFGHLAMAGVTASEPYVLPVAAQLLVAGWSARRKGHDHGVQATQALSSWIAYVPAVALAGGAALVERAQGGAGWHALVAGAVGVAAVALGGWRRLAGPMVVGTVLLVVLSVRESLSALAGVPTWAWLGLGGTVLLTVAVALERSDTSPLEAGRRIVEVMGERFS